jgi:chemotaxis protein histidine kinase CheA
MLQEFIQSAERELTQIGTWLMASGDSEKHHDLLQNIYRSVHLIKGNASLLNLSMFADQAHRFEDKISEIQKKAKVKKSDFIILNDELLAIKKTLAEVNNLLERIGKIHEQMRPRRSFEQKILLDSFKNLVKQLGQEQEKKIKLKVDHFKIEDIPHAHRIFIKELIVQLLRNAVAHGIEPVEERIRKQKRNEARIELRTVSNNGDYIVEVRDDGCGLQLERIKKRAIELGRWKKDEIEKWDHSRLADIIFEAGFSTSENTDLISGRGVGLDLVKSRVEEKKGRISVEYEEDRYCKFSLKLPVNGSA